MKICEMTFVEFQTKGQLWSWGILAIEAVVFGVAAFLWKRWRAKKMAAAFAAPPPPSPRRELIDRMRVDKFDRLDLDGVEWVLLLPGMYDEMKLATTEEFLAYLGFEPDGDFARAIADLRIGTTWVPLKEGIAIRLAWKLDPRDYES